MTKSDENNKDDFVRKKWYIDSGCSKHMTDDVSKFTTISPKNSGHVTYGNDTEPKEHGMSQQLLLLKKLTRHFRLRWSKAYTDVLCQREKATKTYTRLQ